MIVATAGHVDHGKTSLIKQLTGVETDRLEEEKRRGLSINLGFAYRTVDDKHTLGFIDVPGHTRFINTMIAGVGGVDLGMLVVAADDGPMPQTLEHLDVLRLLGIRQFVLVVSKIDRVEAERVAQVCTQVRALLPDVDCELFPLSNITGEGVTELQRYLDALTIEQQQRSAAGNFRLSVDRAFTLKGVGLVLTGTAIAGRVAIGDELELLPQGEKLRVRSLRVHDKEAELGSAGERCALNLVGNIDKAQIDRGDMLVAPGALRLSERFDARFSLLATAPFALKHLAPVKLHLGARRVAGRIFIIEDAAGKRLQPGASALVQILLDEPLACCRGDRFLVRDDSESVTLGGGMVLDPKAPKTGKGHAYRLAYMAAMEQDSAEQALAMLLEGADQTADKAVNLTAFSQSWNLREDECESLLQSLPIKRFDADEIEFALPLEAWQLLGKDLVQAVRTWQRNNPLQQGVKASALQQLMKASASSTLFRAALSEELRNGKLSLVGGLVHTVGHKPMVSAAQQESWSKVEAALLERGVQLPLVSELMSVTGLQKETLQSALFAAGKNGLVYKLNDKRYGLPIHLQQHAAMVAELADSEAGITVIGFRDRLDAGRKLAIEILEHFDEIRFTQRRGESRVIINAGLPAERYSQ